ncbi:OX-2 membrane glycoprotein isoform X6 [Canis lupus dingo]|uniref:OX-2 membrane glycoprotein isoform X6 n=1 Tax=Canis lupus dingo TaxID=286419 RepID=UPI0020C40A92|nr:OX-2 membrane glycoprotein isoform X6 [Canis lupus dingo]
MKGVTSASSTLLVLGRSREQPASPSLPTVFLHYNFFEDQLNITCFANARPAPVISWKVAGSGIENSTEVLLHPNGTTSVISILHVKDPKRQVGKEVVCQVLHLGTVTSLRQTVDKGFWFSVPLLLSIVSLVILLVLISILLYWKRRRNQDRDFIYLFMRNTERGRERQRHRQREKQAPCREPHVGLDPGSPGSHPGLKAALNH